MAHMRKTLWNVHVSVCPVFIFRDCCSHRAYSSVSALKYSTADKNYNFPPLTNINLKNTLNFERFLLHYYVWQYEYILHTN